MTIIRQIGLLLGLCFAAQCVEALLPFAFPASVIAMLMLLACLLWACCATGGCGRLPTFY